MAAGDDALREAVAYYIEWVYRVSVIGKGAPAGEWEAPLFTYLLTRKQHNELKVICSRQQVVGSPFTRMSSSTFLPRARAKTA